MFCSVSTLLSPISFQKQLFSLFTELRHGCRETSPVPPSPLFFFLLLLSCSACSYPVFDQCWPSLAPPPHPHPPFFFTSISTYSRAFRLEKQTWQVIVAWILLGVTSQSGWCRAAHASPFFFFKSISRTSATGLRWMIVFVCFVSCSCAAPSSRRLARRKPSHSRHTTRWRRWATRCHPHPNCSTTTGRAAWPHCAPLPPPQSEFFVRPSQPRALSPSGGLHVLMRTNQQSQHILPFLLLFYLPSLFFF